MTRCVIYGSRATKFNLNFNLSFNSPDRATLNINYA